MTKQLLHRSDLFDDLAGRYLIALQLIAIGAVILPGCAGLRPSPKFTDTDTSTEETRGHRIRQAPRNASAFESSLRRQVDIYLGVPYRWGGRTKSGMDCSGFVSVVYENGANLKLPHKASQMYRLGHFVESGSLHFGDLLFFENIESRGISHVGLYMGNNTFAHASTTKGVVISHLNEKYYRDRYAGAKRVFER